MNRIASIPEAIADYQQGKMVILVDDEDRENEGDLIIAAEFADAAAVNFMTKYGRGLVCLSMLGEQLDHLGLPMMTTNNRSAFGTPFTISIEAATGVTTGISAFDRARTIAVAVDPASGPQDVVSPGHIFPLRAQDHGVLVRPGQTEGCVDLARLAGLKPAAVLCEIMNDDGTMARMPQLQEFAQKHDLKIVTIADLIKYRTQHETLVEIVAETRLPLEGLGDFQIKVFQDKITQQEHLVLQKGEVNSEKPCLVRVHSQCATGDIFHSQRCDCGWQLQAALEQIAEHGGLLVYLQQEGRGIGLANKIKAYALQDKGYDTVEANHQLGFADDLRDYAVAAQILRALHISQLRLLTNNLRKVDGLEQCGLTITERVSLESTPNSENLHYLQTKRDKLGHLLNFKTK